MTIAATELGNAANDPGTGKGRSHGTSKGAPFDRWFRYPAGFASDYVTRLLDEAEITSGVVVDPFMGSGVTGTAALSRGLSFAGIEAHPLVAELAGLKFSTDFDPDQVRREARRLSAAGDNTTALEETALVTRSFAPTVLKTLVGLREQIKELEPGTTALALKWALLATLRDVADVKVGWPYQRPGVSRQPRHLDPAQRFVDRASMIADDVTLRPRSVGTATISVGSAADPTSWTTLPSASACITSPPYLNNFDYADATRLELYFWGEIRTWREMCDSVRSDMIIATTQQSSKSSKQDALLGLREELGDVGSEIADLTSSIADARAARGGRTKEYDQVTPPYFLTMSRILKNLSASMLPGSTAIWLVGDSAPYGVYVDTPALIGRVAVQAGFEFREDTLLRHRGKRWSRVRAHALSERMIVLRKP